MCVATRCVFGAIQWQEEGDKLQTLLYSPDFWLTRGISVGNLIETTFLITYKITRLPHLPQTLLILVLVT
jgi:hypothetical protein